jgi:hypothetical protein
MNNDSRHKDVTGILKSLQQVKAPGNFETELLRKIDSQRSLKKESFLERIFTPSRLVPSAAFVVAAVILFFFLFNEEDAENPLLTEPRIREDVFATEDISQPPLNNELSKEGLSIDEKKLSEPKQKPTQDKTFAEDSNIAEFRNNNSSLRENTPYAMVGYSIDKNGLNFRQINLSKEEQQQLSRLREHFKTLLRAINN